MTAGFRTPTHYQTHVYVLVRAFSIRCEGAGGEGRGGCRGGGGGRELALEHLLERKPLAAGLFAGNDLQIQDSVLCDDRLGLECAGKHFLDGLPHTGQLVHLAFGELVGTAGSTRAWQTGKEDEMFSPRLFSISSSTMS